MARRRRLSELEEQGLIQVFEFTYEPAWKPLKDFVESRGASGLCGSKDVPREAFAREWKENEGEWMTMIQSRNRSRHTDSEKTAREIVEAIRRSFARKFAAFLEAFLELKAKA